MQMGKQKEGRRGTVGNIHIAYSSQACPGSGQRGEPGNNANILTKRFLSGGRSGGREACGERGEMCGEGHLLQEAVFFLFLRDHQQEA